MLTDTKQLRPRLLRAGRFSRKDCSRNKVSISCKKDVRFAEESDDVAHGFQGPEFRGSVAVSARTAPHAFFLFRSGRLDPSFAAQITGSPICYFLVQLAHRCTRENNNRVRAVSATFYLRFASERTRRKRFSDAIVGDPPGRARSHRSVDNAISRERDSTRAVGLSFRKIHARSPPLCRRV